MQKPSRTIQYSGIIFEIRLEWDDDYERNAIERIYREYYIPEKDNSNKYKKSLESYLAQQVQDAVDKAMHDLPVGVEAKVEIIGTQSHSLSVFLSAVIVLYTAIAAYKDFSESTELLRYKISRAVYHDLNSYPGKITVYVNTFSELPNSDSGEAISNTNTNKGWMPNISIYTSTRDMIFAVVLIAALIEFVIIIGLVYKAVMRVYFLT